MAAAAGTRTAMKPPVLATAETVPRGLDQNWVPSTSSFRTYWMFEESVRERTGAESCCYDLRFLSPCIKSHRLKIWEIQVTVLFTENKFGPYRVHGIFMPGVTQLFVFPFVNAAQFSTCTFLKPSTNIFGSMIKQPHLFLHSTFMELQ